MTLQQDRIDWEKSAGLVPAIVQHACTGRVLMLAYMNVAAFEQTRSSGWVTFFSRSRQRLWTKGESSGNRLALRGIELDCDGDTLLVQAEPVGPACHLLRNSCFDGDTERRGFGFIGQLEDIIRKRIAQTEDVSYTAQLASAGTQRIAQKVGEEGVEVALAAMAGDRAELIAESADLMYHVLVLLQQQHIGIGEVAAELQARHNAGKPQ